MTTITSTSAPSYPTPAGGAQATNDTTAAQSTTAAGAASGATDAVPAEVGQGGLARTNTAGKPALSAPKTTGAAGTSGVSQSQRPDVGSARQKADAKLDRATMLREIRKDRREAVCAKAFELQDFGRLVIGPLSYCLKNPVQVVAGALALGAATAVSISTGNLTAFKAAMPAVSTMIGGLVKSSGVEEMLQRGTELALLTLGVDPQITQKWGDAVGASMFVGANVAMNAIAGTWEKIDFSSLGDLAADVAVLLNVPTQNAAALSAIVRMAGSGAVAVGAGIVAGDYKDLTAENFTKVWDTLKQKLEDGKFKLSDITELDAFKSMNKSWGALVDDFGNLQKFADALNVLFTPVNGKTTYRA
jgi:hypothetical protein